MSDLETGISRICKSLEACDDNSIPDTVARDIEGVSKFALEQGFAGLYEILSRLVNVSVNKNDLLFLFKTINQYLKVGNKTDSGHALQQAISNSAFKKYFNKNDLGIITGLLEIDSQTGKSTISTELDLEDDLDDEDLLDSTNNVQTRISGTRKIIIDDNVPAELRELLEIMQSELIPVENNLLELAVLLNIEKDFGNLAILHNEISASLDIYAEAVAAFDFKGLGLFINKMKEYLLVDQDNFDALEYRSRIQSQTDLIDIIFSYLNNPANLSLVQKLSTYAKVNGWDKESDKFSGRNIENLLLIDTKSAQNTSEIKQIVTAADVSLDLPDDISTDLLDALLEELPDQIQELTASVFKLSENGTLDDIQTAKRIAHTLKGAGNTVGITGIATITHRLEDILLFLFKNGILPTGFVLDLILRTVDCLAEMADYLLDVGKLPANSNSLLQELIDVSYDFKINGKSDSEYLQKEAMLHTSISLPANENTILSQNKGGTDKNIKVSATFIDELLKLVSVSIIDNKQIINSLQESINQINLSREIFSELRYFSNKAEELLVTKDLGKITNNGISQSGYDSLELDHYSDLHVFIQQVIEKTFDAEQSTQSLLDNLLAINEKLLIISKLNYQINSSIEKNRQIPVAGHVSRFERIVRQAASLSEKNVTLNVTGIDTLIDSEIFNSITEALIHLLRNAVDHGIEAPGVRRDSGKNESGLIKLKFSSNDEYINIIVEDDGNGLNTELIKNKAVEMGIIQASEKYSDEDIHNLIFNPDFSTKTETSQLSGRGIGMDAVYTAIKSLSGDISIHSNSGKGTSFNLRIPSSQMTVNSIIVGIGANCIAISTRGIEQVFYIDQVQVDLENDNYTYKSVVIDDQRYDVIEIESLLQLNTERRTKDRQPPLFILFSLNKQKKKVVLVDRITGCENIIMKSMGSYIPKLNGILGVSVLGNGNIIPIMDVIELIENYIPGAYNTTRSFRSRKKLPTVLIVDDSLSVRRSLIQFMQDMGYQTRAANDGLEGYEIASACNPELIITDMEMPRMNGIELVSHLKSLETTSEIPIIMITSRSAQIHIDEAQTAGVDDYLTKPYSEDELLEIIKKLNRARLTS